jgi:hypothetical protein
MYIGLAVNPSVVGSFGKLAVKPYFARWDRYVQNLPDKGEFR